MDPQPRKQSVAWLGIRCRIRAIAAMAFLATAVAPCVAQALTRIQLTPTGLGRYGDDMGHSVALTGDTAVVGAPNTQLAPAFNSGVVDVYRQEDVVWQPEGILIANDASPGMAFGSSVAVGQDLIVVGAGTVGSIYTFERDGTSWAQVDKLATPVSNDIGLSGETLVSAGYVYVRAGSGWELQTQLTGDGDPTEVFGNSSAIDGDRLAVLSYTVSSPSFIFQQYVYFFSRSGTVWTREAKFDLGLTSYPASHVAIQGQTAIVGVSSTGLGTVRAYDRDTTGVWSDRGILDAGTDLLGAVPVSLDGDRALAGSPGDGTAYTFVRSGDTWTRELHFNDPTYFGCFTSLALSASTVLAGCPGGLTPSGGYGKADVFSLDSNPPPIIAQFDQGNAHAGEAFGQGVALSGSTLLAGSVGAAYVFEGSGGTSWLQQARLPVAVSFSQGVAVPLALDADTAAILYSLDVVDVYVRTGNVWTLQETLQGVGTNYTYFGWSLTLQENTLVVGEPQTLNEFPTEAAGASHVFVRAGSTWTEQVLLQPAEGLPGDEFGFATSLSGDTLLVGAPRSDTGIETHAGAVYVYVRSGDAWTQKARLLAPVVASHAGFGVSVALKGNTAVIGANNKDLPEDSTRGAAYVYKRNGDLWVWQATLIPPIPPPIPGAFGRSVAISDTEDKILVGSPFGLPDDTNAGLVFAFAFDGAQWVPASTLQGSPPFPPNGWDYFGTSVAFSGNDYAIGATNDGVGGAVYLGSLSDSIFSNGFDAAP